MLLQAALERFREKSEDKLYSHSLRVQETSLHIAERCGVNKEKAALAGLLHDYGRIYPLETLHRLAVSHDLVDYLTLQEPALLHAPVGAWLLERELGLDDKEVLEAVKMHTTGGPGISLLARVIYLADYIEPARSCAGVEEVREMWGADLDRALLYTVDMTTRYVLEKRSILHANTVYFRNELILKIRNLHAGVAEP